MQNAIQCIHIATHIKWHWTLCLILPEWLHIQKGPPVLGWLAVLCLFSTFPPGWVAGREDNEVLRMLWFATALLLLCVGELGGLQIFWGGDELLLLACFCEEAFSFGLLVTETSIPFWLSFSCCCNFCIFSCMLLSSAKLIISQQFNMLFTVRNQQSVCH